MNILKIDASVRYKGSTGRDLSHTLIDQLKTQGEVTIVERDLGKGLPLIDEAWVGANFTPEENRTEDQRKTLALSDTLIAELEAADAMVISMPIYNFGVPAGFKAWVDLIARARKTFRYTEKGPVGLLDDRPVFVIISSGGTAIGSDADFASGYIKQVLDFVGINDVRFLDASQLMIHGDAKADAVRDEIKTISLQPVTA